MVYKIKSYDSTGSVDCVLDRLIKDHFDKMQVFYDRRGVIIEIADCVWGANSLSLDPLKIGRLRQESKAKFDGKFPRADPLNPAGEHIQGVMAEYEMGRLLNVLPSTEIFEGRGDRKPDLAFRKWGIEVKSQNIANGEASFLYWKKMDVHKLKPDTIMVQTELFVIDKKLGLYKDFKPLFWTYGSDLLDFLSRYRDVDNPDNRWEGPYRFAKDKPISYRKRVKYLRPWLELKSLLGVTLVPGDYMGIPSLLESRLISMGWDSKRFRVVPTIS